MFAENLARQQDQEQCADPHPVCVSANDNAWRWYSKSSLQHLEVMDPYGSPRHRDKIRVEYMTLYHSFSFLFCSIRVVCVWGGGQERSAEYRLAVYYLEHPAERNNLHHDCTVILQRYFNARDTLSHVFVLIPPVKEHSDANDAQMSDRFFQEITARFHNRSVNRSGNIVHVYFPIS